MVNYIYCNKQSILYLLFLTTFYYMAHQEESTWVREREELLAPAEVKYHVDDQEMLEKSSSSSLKDLAGTDLFAVDGKSAKGKQDEQK